MSASQISTQASRFFDSVSTTASNLTSELSKKIQYTGDMVYFEADDKQDEDLRCMLAATDSFQSYEALKVLHVRLTRGQDIRRFYPDIVMCIHKEPHESKRLAYLILVQIQDSQDS